MKKISGIYCIENLINGKKYIGQASDLYKRKNAHFLNLNNGVHPSKHLQFAFNKYGKDNFVFKVLIYCESFELTKYEQFFVDIIPNKLLYNKCLECVNSKKGVRTSEKTKKILSKMKKGKSFSDEAKNHMSVARMGEKNSFFGRHHTEETKKRISEIKKNPSEETRQKISNSNKGKHHTEEAKKKISLMTSGKNNPMYGKHHSESTKIKIINNKSTTKLNEEKVKEIISKLLEGNTIKSLGEEYGVSFKQISKIKNNQRWKYIMPDKREFLINKRIKK